MATNKLAFGASTPLTITLINLPTNTGRTSVFVDNTIGQYHDAHVSLKFTTGAGTIGSYKAVTVYAYGSEDGVTYGPFGGPTGKEAVDGTDKSIGLNADTEENPSTLWGRRIGVIHVQFGATGVAYVSPPLGVAQAFGGMMPRRWGIVVENRCGVAFAGSGCSASYTGIATTIL